MTTTRETKQDGFDAMHEYLSGLTRLRPAGLLEEKLRQLQSFITQMARTPTGRDELERRVSRFGQCRPIAGESAAQFSGKLREWLDRDTD